MGELIMKKVLICLFSVVVLFSLSGCSQATTIKVNCLNTDRITLANTPNDLQQISDLIIVFTPRDQENVLMHYSDGNVSVGYTKTTGIVTKILSGDILEGAEITITEECYTTNSGSELWTQQGYLPMRIGEAYLLFLKEYSPESKYAGMYFPIDLEHGKYVLPIAATMTANTSLNAEQLEVGPATDLSEYAEWYEAVCDLYPDLFY